MGAAAAGAGIGAIGSVGGAIIQSGAARDAAAMQNDAANRANDLQYKMYQQTRTDQEPWRNAGVGALSDMQNPDFQRNFTTDDFQKDPGYDFRMQEGQNALERSAAARGGLQNGGTLKELAQYGQNFASNEYGNAYNRFNNDRNLRFGRLSSIAGMGQNANNVMSNANNNYANQSGEITLGNGNAQAASRAAVGNIWGNTVSSIGKSGMDAMAMGGGSPGGGKPGGGANWYQQSANSVNNNPAYFNDDYSSVSNFGKFGGSNNAPRF